MYNEIHLWIELLHVHAHVRDSASTNSAPPDHTVRFFSHLSALKDASHGKGMGAFTTSAIAKGSTVREYTGEPLTQRDVEARYWDQRKVNKHNCKWRNSSRRRNQGLSEVYCLFDMWNDSFIDGEDVDVGVSSWYRFANHHATSPNDGDCDGDEI